MRLKIPKEQAIAILEKRKSEIYKSDFEPKVWKETTESDLREIFDGRDFKWMNISQIKFTTPFSDENTNVLAKGKEQAEKFMNSFIEQIEEYSKIAETKTIEREKYLESENDNLRVQMSGLMTKASGLIDDQNELLDELNEKDTKIEHLEKKHSSTNGFNSEKNIWLNWKFTCWTNYRIIDNFIRSYWICFLFRNFIRKKQSR